MNFLKINIYYKVLLFVFIFLFFAYNKIYASLEITKIMYDPEGSDVDREWVEIYNSGNSVINITGGKTNQAWRISDGSLGDKLHYLSEDIILGPKSRAVIAKNKDVFLSEYSSFDGDVVSSSISLPNTSGIVKILNGDDPRKTIVEKSYDVSDLIEEIYIEENIDDEEYNTSYKSSVLKTDEDKKIKIITTTAKIISDKTTIAGLAVNFDAKISNNKGIISNIGRFVWNFGDGTSTERDSVGVFDHVFWYPGEYVVVLNYYKKGDNEIKASDRITIKVLPSSLNIYIGSLEDPYIEIENKSSYEINLSNWKIKTINKEFLIPDGTFILPNKKIKISPKITGFNFYELSKVEIFNPNGEIMSFYPKNLKNNKVEKSIHPQNINTKIVEVKEVENSDSINLNENLKANALTEKSDFKINFYLLGLFIVILLGIFVIVLTNRNNIDEGDEISAKNFKILE